LPFEQVEQRGHESIDAAAEVLEIEQEHVRARHHLRARTADLPVETVDRDAVSRIAFVLGLDHVVLLVALEPVLRTEGARHVDARGDQRIERMDKVLGNRSRVRHERDALAFERGTQFRVCQ